jgi:hypothetical protein
MAQPRKRLKQAKTVATGCDQLPIGAHGKEMTCSETPRLRRGSHAVSCTTELEEVSMGIVVALDVHRNQITYKALDRETGELRRGRIAPATRVEVRAWLGQFADSQAEFAVEGTTGWRFVVEEIERVGQRAHLADPAETAARRGRKRRAKTDNADCDLLLRLLLAGELPESWIPPAQILELRTLVRLRGERSCRRPAASSSRWGCACSTRSISSWRRSTASCARLPATNPAAAR